ncbi:PepSY-associated TM helix domain-containing protein [Amycolatopsis jejuensis]|uniref:PepSY-associated TM helix domain-containing protein n=1 Tax=Amycolatopsis jejuensis TaxID=330084 RepID=UPI001B807887|nr:PepSY-associated TM helix domain-containing protein [Amycolatopsis jejuensis]
MSFERPSSGAGGRFGRQSSSAGANPSRSFPPADAKPPSPGLGRRLLFPSGGKPGRRRLLSWHGTAGLWIALGLLFLSATGLTWSLHAGANITTLRSTLDWTTPSMPAGTGTPGDVGWQTVRDATARAGLADPVEIRPPAAGGGYAVEQVGSGWPDRRDSMSVDPGTGRLTGTLRFADFPLAAKLSSWGIDAHMGALFGLANQILLTVLGVTLMCVIGWGYRMWWHRRPTRARPEDLPVGDSQELLPAGDRARVDGATDDDAPPGATRVGPSRVGGASGRGRVDRLPVARVGRLPVGRVGRPRVGWIDRLSAGRVGGASAGGLVDRLSAGRVGGASGRGRVDRLPVGRVGRAPVGWLGRPGVGRVAWLSGGRFGRPPARGTWRRVPGRVLAPVLVGAAGLAWFLPVFGLSLLGFLVLDYLVGLRRGVAR